MIIEDAKSIESLQMVIVELTPPQANDDKCKEKLKALLQEYSGEKNQGKIPVQAWVAPPYPRGFSFSSKYWVQDCNTVVTVLNAAGFIAYPSPLRGN